MEKSEGLISFPEDYKPNKQDHIKNYAMVDQIYAHPVSPTIISLVKNLESNTVSSARILVMHLQVDIEGEAHVDRTNRISKARMCSAGSNVTSSCSEVIRIP